MERNPKSETEWHLQNQLTEPSRLFAFPRGKNGSLHSVGVRRGFGCTGLVKSSRFHGHHGEAGSKEYSGIVFIVTFSVGFVPRSGRRILPCQVQEDLWSHSPISIYTEAQGTLSGTLPNGPFGNSRLNLCPSGLVVCSVMTFRLSS